MANLWVIAPIIGNGSDASPYRADVGEVNHIALIPSDPATGAPVFDWALCKVAAADLTATLARPGIRAMPNIGLDDVLTTQQRNAIGRFMSDEGVALTIPAGSTFREALLLVGRTLDADLSPLAFDGELNVGG